MHSLFLNSLVVTAGRECVLLMCSLCLDFEIHDAGLWSNVLDQMCALKMTEQLKHVLVRLSGLPVMWGVASLEKSWARVIAMTETASPSVPASAAALTTLNCIVQYGTVSPALVVSEFSCPDSFAGRPLFFSWTSPRM